MCFIYVYMNQLLKRNFESVYIHIPNYFNKNVFFNEGQIFCNFDIFVYPTFSLKKYQFILKK